jgi:HD superfamily phosphodiesterase
MKEKLTVEKAKEFTKKLLMESGSKDGEFWYNHMKAVSETCLVLAAREENVDLESLEIAGWVHDLGYLVSEESHAKYSLETVEKEFEINEIIRDCIINHGNSGDPKTKEGKIIKFADKLAFLNKDFLGAILKANPGKIDKEYIDYTEMALKRIPKILGEL